MSYCTAGIIVIGDEILKGVTLDTNSHYVCKKLYSMGISVKKISVIPDDVEIISKEVHEFSQNYDVVITSGGIGPTHDDVTYNGVAKAFGENLEFHREMANIIVQHYPGSQVSCEKNPALKMAYLPKSATLLFVNHRNGGKYQIEEDFPVVRVGNVLIFPGLPQYLEFSFSRLKFDDLFPSDDSSNSGHSRCFFHCYRLYYSAGEVQLVGALDEAVAHFSKRVNFGSYPVIGNRFYSTLITVESFDEALANEAVKYLRNKIPKEFEVPPPREESQQSESLEEILTSQATEYMGKKMPKSVEVPTLPEELKSGPDKDIMFSSIPKQTSEKVYQLMKDNNSSNSLVQPLKHAIETIEECFHRYDPSEEIFISFNGGKDCTVLLHLVFAVYIKCFPNGSSLKALYIQTEDPFPELETFVEISAKRYNLQLQTLQGPLKKALRNFTNWRSSLKAVLIGTRRSDPKSVALLPFQMTDGDWPKLMRVSPILDWTYEDVWTFLRILSIPYCCLYDQGYTSIGDRCNTFPNPELEFVGEDGKKHYHPAYTLKDGASERSGRQFGVIKSAAELTLGIVETIISAFGPNGRAVLFSRKNKNSSNITGSSSIISRSGLEIIEILASKNESGTVHPLLKPLIDACKRLEMEWGDGVKSLVIITSELLRQCASLDSQVLGCLRIELQKVLCCLDETAKVTLPITTSFHNKPFKDQFTYPQKEDHVQSVELHKPLVSEVDRETYNLLQMFFSTRFPPHVCDVIPMLLSNWLKNLEKNDSFVGINFEFVIDNFGSLCHIDAGLSIDQSWVLNGILVNGVGIGHMFETRVTSEHKETINFHFRNKISDTKFSSFHSSHPMKIRFITEDELLNLEMLLEKAKELKYQYLFLTSCIVTDFVKYKIHCIHNISIIHSISKDDLDVLQCILCQPIPENGEVENCDLKWIRQWTRQVTFGPGKIWLGFPQIWSLILCVPMIGMEEGLKQACWNAIRLVHQFKIRKLEIFTMGRKVVERQCSTTVTNFLDCCYSNDRSVDVTADATVNLSSLGNEFNAEKIILCHSSCLKFDAMVVAGGLAEMLLHDLVIGWWLVPPPGCTYTVKREIAKAVSQACLSVPRCLSSSSGGFKMPLKTMNCNLSGKFKEVMAHRLQILHYAVSVVYSLSNISDLHFISKNASKMKLTS